MKRIKRWKFTQAMLMIAPFQVRDAHPTADDQPKQQGLTKDRGFMFEAIGPAKELTQINFVVAASKDVGLLTERLGWLTIALKTLHPGWVEIHRWLESSLLKAMQGQTVYESKRKLKVHMPEQGVLIVAVGVDPPSKGKGFAKAKDAIAIPPMA